MPPWKPLPIETIGHRVGALSKSRFRFFWFLQPPIPSRTNRRSLPASHSVFRLPGPIIIRPSAAFRYIVCQPQAPFQKVFARPCMEAQETSSVSSDPDSFNVSESLVPVRELKAPGITSVSFDGLLKEPLLLKEDLRNGCGGQLWPAGMVLAKYMLREHRSDLLGKTMSVPLPRPLSLPIYEVAAALGLSVLIFAELNLARAAASLGSRSLAVVL